MKLRLFSVILMFVPLVAQAEDDPILFTVGDMSVTRSEFEQSYLKNTTVSRAGQQKIADYLELYIAYKLKVKAALDAHLDTTSSFRQVYLSCVQSQQKNTKEAAESSIVSYADEQTLKVYAGKEELIRLSQIMIRVPQKASRDMQLDAQKRINAIYQEVQSGADFDQLTRRYSQDGQLSVIGQERWYARGQMLQEIEDVAFSLRDGEVSRPFLSTFGYHILAVKERIMPGSSELFQRPLSPVPDTKEDFQIPTSGLQKEYFEGLLLCELNNQSVGRHAAEDEGALKYFFKKNKKKYRRKGFKPKDYTEVRELVVADLQEEMNKHWLVDLRKAYPVYVNKKVLKTVNNHL